MRVLIAEDDPEIGQAIRDGLAGAGYSTEVVRNGNDILPKLKQEKFSLLLLDIMLPGMHGFEVCKQVRISRFQLPILMITARDTLHDRVRGLDSGADDYLTKPFLFPELLARMRALLRRQDMIKSSEMQIGDLFMDTAKHIVRRADQEIMLTPREYQLLQLFMKNEGSAVTKERIAEEIWYDEFTSVNTIEVHVRNLRKKMDEGFETRLIHTIYGNGYTLREQG